MDLTKIGIGEKAPEVVNALVEIPKGSHNKYEYDDKMEAIKLDRVLYSPFHYPADYGLIPETLSEDGDHLDALILGSDPLFPGCVVEIRPIGLFKMIDSGENDYKVLAVQKDNPRFNDINDISDIERSNAHLLKEISHFFQTYKELQGKKVEVLGWENKAAAIEIIKKSQEAHKAKMSAN